MKQHSTKVLQDIVNGLGSFIQSQFVTQTQSSISLQSGKSPSRATHACLCTSATAVC